MRGKFYKYSYIDEEGNMDKESKDLDCCRECGHFRFLHCEEQAWAGRCDPQNDYGCDCKEYVPEDNLDYVEWLAEKRGLLK